MYLATIIIIIIRSALQSINMVDYNNSTELLKSSGTLRLPWRRYKLLHPISMSG